MPRHALVATELSLENRYMSNKCHSCAILSLHPCIELQRLIKFDHSVYFQHINPKHADEGFIQGQHYFIFMKKTEKE